MRRLRFALLYGEGSLEPWHGRCLDRLEPVAELVGVVAVAAAPRPLPRGRLMRWYARRVQPATIDLGERAPRLPVDRLPELDFVLALGPALELEEHSIWSFEHEARGDALPFFREVYDGVDVTYAALVSSREGVLEEGWFRTEKRSYVRSRDRVLDGLAEWPARACARLLAGAEGGSAACAPPATRRERRPWFLRLAAAIATRRLKVARDRLFRHPQWNVGTYRGPAAELANDGYVDDRVEWAPLEGRERFLADPFGVERDGTLHVLCEEFSYRTSKGRIRAVDLADQTQPALELRGHASYPFLLEEAGEVYCVPETAEADEVALYRADELPSRWTKAGVLLADVAGLDPTVFRHDGRWWLLCTRRGSREDVELWAWHASELLGPWSEHARNPVKTDVRSARPGGRPFVLDGQLYRPAQDSSRAYGWRVAIQRVMRLTPTEFAEEPVAVVEPSAASPYPDGRHTLCPVGDVVLVDGLRHVFVSSALRAFLRIWARDLAAKLHR